MEKQITRGVWLSGFLILVVLASIGDMVTYIHLWNEMASLYPMWAIYILFSIAVLRFFSAVAIWYWSKTGVVAYVALSAAAIIILLYLGQNLSLIGIGGAVILIALSRSKWGYMSWSLSLSPRVG